MRVFSLYYILLQYKKFIKICIKEKKRERHAFFLRDLPIEKLAPRNSGSFSFSNSLSAVR